MKKRMIPGIVLSALAVYMAFETVLLYNLITRPDGTFITDADVAFGLYLFGGLLELNPSLTYPNAPPYLFALCAVTVLLALAAVLCFWRARRGKPERSLYKVGRVMTAVTVGAVAVLFLLANLWPGFPSLGKLDNFLVFNDDWGTYRGTGWRAAWGTWWDASLWRKVLGYGPGTMHKAMVDWAGDALTDRMNTFYAAHNEYLEQLLTTGILGLAAWLGFVGVHLRRGFAAWARPGVAPVLLALCSYLVQAVVSIRVSMLFPLVMVLFGLLWVLSAPGKVAEPVPAGPVTCAGAVRYGKIILCAVAAMALSAPLSHLVLWFLF